MEAFVKAGLLDKIEKTMTIQREYMEIAGAKEDV